MTTLLKTLALLIAVGASALTFAGLAGVPLPAHGGEFALAAFAGLVLLALAIRDYQPRRRLTLPPSAVARSLRVAARSQKAPFERALAA